MKNLCLCGCGELAKPGNKFICGHNNKGKSHQAWNKGLTKNTDTRLRIHSEYMKTFIPWNKGLTKDTDIRVKQYSKSLKGLVRSEEFKRKISQALSGKKRKPYPPFSKEHKKKLRIAQLKHIQEQFLNNEPLSPTVGKNARICLNEIEVIFKYKIVREFPIIGYFLDGYIQELNIAIEFQEKLNHTSKRARIHDKEKQENIIEEINCIYIIIWENEWDNNREMLIQQIKKEISWQELKKQWNQ